jgi:hypothetical protein
LTYVGSVDSNGNKWSTPELRARKEALLMVVLLGAGHSPQRLRKDIVVTDRERRELRQFLLPSQIETLVDFRARVACAFDEILTSRSLPRLIAEGERRRQAVIKIHARHYAPRVTKGQSRLATREDDWS